MKALERRHPAAFCWCWRRWSQWTRWRRCARGRRMWRWSTISPWQRRGTEHQRVRFSTICSMPCCRRRRYRWRHAPRWRSPICATALGDRYRLRRLLQHHDRRACPGSSVRPAVNGKCDGFEVVQPLIDQAARWRSCRACGSGGAPGKILRPQADAGNPPQDLRRLPPRRAPAPAIAAFLDQLQKCAKAYRADHQEPSLAGAPRGRDRWLSTGRLSSAFFALALAVGFLRRTSCVQQLLLATGLAAGLPMSGAGTCRRVCPRSSCSAWSGAARAALPLISARLRSFIVGDPRRRCHLLMLGFEEADVAARIDPERSSGSPFVPARESRCGPAFLVVAGEVEAAARSSTPRRPRCVRLRLNRVAHLVPVEHDLLGIARVQTLHHQVDLGVADQLERLVGQRDASMALRSRATAR